MTQACCLNYSFSFNFLFFFFVQDKINNLQRGALLKTEAIYDGFFFTLQQQKNILVFFNFKKLGFLDENDFYVKFFLFKIFYCFFFVLFTHEGFVDSIWHTRNLPHTQPRAALHTTLYNTTERKNCLLLHTISTQRTSSRVCWFFFGTDSLLLEFDFQLEVQNVNVDGRENYVWCVYIVCHRRRRRRRRTKEKRSTFIQHVACWSASVE